MVDPVATSTAFNDLKASEVLKFASTVISAVAWPLGTFFIVRLFKVEILRLIPSLSKFSAMGITAEFTQGMNKAEANIAKIATEPKPDAAQPPDNAVPAEPKPAATTPVSADLKFTYAIEAAPTPDLAELRANPNGIVMVSWAGLESALRRLALSAIHSVTIGPAYGPRVLIDRSVKAGLISFEEERALQELFHLRNLAAHSDAKISEADALRFKEIADRLTGRFLGAIPPTFAE